MDTKQNLKDNTAEDLNQHGVKDIIPNAEEEYYTLDLTRGRSRPSENDLSPIDIASSNPYDNLDTEEPELAMPHTSMSDDAHVVSQVRTDQPSSSNDGGPVAQKDILDQNSEEGYAPGEAGSGEVDEGTG